MMTSQLASWSALLLLGGAHGINPGMGWLFAVALALQEQRRTAIWRTLGPLALGHALAIAVLVMVALSLGVVLPVQIMKWVIAGLLLTLGLMQLRRHYHPSGGGMRVGARDITIWSFLVASAHGAGLMALPFVLGVAKTAPPPAAGGHHGHGETVMAAIPHEQAIGLLATAVHTFGYLLVTVVVAVLVYEKLGLRLLRTAWVNVNLIWAFVLIATALLTPFI